MQFPIYDKDLFHIISYTRTITDPPAALLDKKWLGYLDGHVFFIENGKTIYFEEIIDPDYFKEKVEEEEEEEEEEIIIPIVKPKYFKYRK